MSLLKHVGIIALKSVINWNAESQTHLDFLVFPKSQNILLKSKTFQQIKIIEHRRMAETDFLVRLQQKQQSHTHYITNVDFKFNRANLHGEKNHFAEICDTTLVCLEMNFILSLIL